MNDKMVSLGSSLTCKISLLLLHLNIVVYGLGLVDSAFTSMESIPSEIIRNLTTSPSNYYQAPESSTGSMNSLEQASEVSVQNNEALIDATTETMDRDAKHSLSIVDYFTASEEVTTTSSDINTDYSSPSPVHNVNQLSTQYAQFAGTDSTILTAILKYPHRTEIDMNTSVSMETPISNVIINDSTDLVPTLKDVVRKMTTLEVNTDTRILNTVNGIYDDSLTTLTSQSFYETSSMPNELERNIDITENPDQTPGGARDILDNMASDITKISTNPDSLNSTPFPSSLHKMSSATDDTIGLVAMTEENTHTRHDLNVKESDGNMTTTNEMYRASLDVTTSQTDFEEKENVTDTFPSQSTVQTSMEVTSSSQYFNLSSQLYSIQPNETITFINDQDMSTDLQEHVTEPSTVTSERVIGSSTVMLDYESSSDMLQEVHDKAKESSTVMPGMNLESSTLASGMDFKSSITGQIHESSTVSSPETVSKGETDFQSYVTIPFIENQPPELLVPVPLLECGIGQYMQYTIPHDTFHDKEDGGTRNLSLNLLNMDGMPLSPSFWIQFDEKLQSISMLPLTKDDLINEFILIAEDEAGLQSTGYIRIAFNFSSTTALTHSFIMSYDVNYQLFMSNRSNLFQLIKAISVALDSDVFEFLTTNVSAGSLILSWSNSSIDRFTCDNKTILELFNQLDMGLLRYDLMQTLNQSKYPVIDVDLQWMGACADWAPIPHIPLPLSEKNEDWILFVTPVIIILLLVLMFSGLCCLCKRCKKSGHVSIPKSYNKMIKERRPVLLAHELELQLGKNRGHPSIFQDEFFGAFPYPQTSTLNGEPAEESSVHRQSYDNLGYDPIFDESDASPSLPSSDDLDSLGRPPPPSYKLPLAYVPKLDTDV